MLPAPDALLSGEHMVVLVHGFAGSLQDLRLVRAHLRLLAPNTHTHVSAWTWPRLPTALSPASVLPSP